MRQSYFINIQIDESHRNTENLKTIVAEIGQINLNERCPQAVQSPADPLNTDQQDTDIGNEPIGPPPSKLQKKNLEAYIGFKQEKESKSPMY